MLFFFQISFNFSNYFFPFYSKTFNITSNPMFDTYMSLYFYISPYALFYYTNPMIDFESYIYLLYHQAPVNVLLYSYCSLDSSSCSISAAHPLYYLYHEMIYFIWWYVDWNFTTIPYHKQMAKIQKLKDKFFIRKQILPLLTFCQDDIIPLLVWDESSIWFFYFCVVSFCCAAE